MRVKSSGVILSGAPIDWDAVKTFDDMTKFEALLAGMSFMACRRPDVRESA
jgi:hypothetical protein